MDKEALEVALADLPDASESVESDSQLPEETPAKDDDGASAEQATPNDDAAESDANSDDRKSESRSARRRRLKREREGEKDRELAQLRARNDKLQKKVDALTAPKREDYETDAQYAAEMAAHNVKVDQINEESADIKEKTEAAKTSSQDSFNQTAADFFAEGEEKYGDAFGAMKKGPDEGGPAITTAMAEAMFEADNGVDIANHLIQNPDESVRIAQMTPLGQVRAITRLEAKLEAGGSPPPPPPPPPPPRSQAPEPLKKTKPNAVPNKPMSELSIGEYYAARMKQLNS